MSGKHLRVARNGELKAWRSGDKTYSQNPADLGLIAGFGEISVRTRMRGGAERTRTPCQARSSIEPVSVTAPMLQARAHRAVAKVGR